MVLYVCIRHKRIEYARIFSINEIDATPIKYVVEQWSALSDRYIGWCRVDAMSSTVDARYILQTKI